MSMSTPLAGSVAKTATTVAAIEKLSQKGWLVLETGECFEGLAYGKTDWPIRAGEVVFNTSHSGYEEIATDPSYFSQIVLMTAPMQGNYGADSTVWESRQIWLEGFICLEMMNSSRENTWIEQLEKSKVSILTEIDTRRLVQRLRSGGTTWGALVVGGTKEQALEKAISSIASKKKIDSDWVWAASRKQTEKRKGHAAHGPRVAVLDFGSKENILRELEQRCSEVIIFPSRTPMDALMAERPDAIMLTNGPGNPADVQVAAATVRELIGKIPVFGICMGHQVLALALGAQTYKLKFGHRGSNHPIKDELLKKVYMSSQNHGYAVDAQTLPSDVQVTQRNLNDQTVAGIYSAKRNCLGIQYHPESHPGPHEATALFDFFIDEMVKGPRK